MFIGLKSASYLETKSYSGDPLVMRERVCMNEDVKQSQKQKFYNAPFPML